MITLPLAVLSAGLVIAQPATPPSPPTPPVPATPPNPSPPSAPEAPKSTTITVSVVRDGKETTITRSNDGITVVYPGKDGERIEVRAADEAELRRNPEAYELYRRYLGSENPRVRVFSNLGEMGPEVWRIPPVPGIGPRVQMEFDREWAEGLRRQADESLRNSERARARAMEQAERARERLEQLRERNAQQPFSAEPGNPARQLGLQIDRADTALRSQLGDGVLITRVVPNSRAQAMGLQAWDYIKKFGDTEVSEPDQLRELIRAADGPVTLEVLRGGKPLTLTEPAPGR